jgi:hypothetical protein
MASKNIQIEAIYFRRGRAIAVSCDEGDTLVLPNGRVVGLTDDWEEMEEGGLALLTDAQKQAMPALLDDATRQVEAAAEAQRRIEQRKQEAKDAARRAQEVRDAQRATRDRRFFERQEAFYEAKKHSPIGEVFRNVEKMLGQ